MALTQVKTNAIADDAVTGAKIADDTVAEANIANDAISLTELKAGTDGQIISWDASGNPVAVGPGTDGQVLTSTGAGSPPAFEDAAAPVGGANALSFNDGVKTNFGADDDLRISGGSSNSVIQHQDTAAGDLYIDAENSNIYLRSGDGSTGAENAIICENNGKVKLYHSGTHVAETSANGLAFPSGKGIDFGATANSAGTMGSELLDDYEHGTYTPTLFVGGTEAGYVSASTEGHYVKIGKLVWCNASVNINTQNSGTGAITLRGLPYDQDTTNTQRGGGFITQWWGQPSGWVNQNIHLSMDTNNKVYLRFYNGSYMSDLNNGHLDDAHSFHYVLTYFAA